MVQRIVANEEMIEVFYSEYCQEDKEKLFRDIALEFTDDDYELLSFLSTDKFKVNDYYSEVPIRSGCYSPRSEFPADYVIIKNGSRFGNKTQINQRIIKLQNLKLIKGYDVHGMQYPEINANSWLTRKGKEFLEWYNSNQRKTEN